jgi:DNA-binding NtrC family response regulator
VRKPVLLVVDDEEGPRTSLKVVFKNEYDVLLATNGTEAVKIARENKVDIAILDILMHGMSGVDVLRELKQIDEGIEVIMLTAYETLETARQALRLGAREYLNKPFDITALRNAARSALAKRRTNQDLKSAHTRLAQLQAEISKMTGDVPAARAGSTRRRHRGQHPARSQQPPHRDQRLHRTHPQTGRQRREDRGRGI